MIGKTLSHYRIDAELGSGGMGVVYRARDLHLDRDVALKVLPSDALADPAARKRFRREAQVLSQLQHPHINVVHDFDVQDGVEFLVMELVPGETLDRRLAAGALPEGEVVHLGLQIAAALGAAHEASVLHRDLKPGNVMVTPQGEAKVLDFGLAKRLPGGAALTTTLTQPQELTGTLAYMAPEQLLGEELDARTDLYALGVVLFEMATGRRPYEADVFALVNAILNEGPPAPRQLRPQLSEQLEAVILKCLARDKADRYPSARALIEDLRAGAPVALAPRRRALALGAGGVVALLAVGLVVALNVGGIRARLTGDRPIRSLAVLPLANLSRDPEQEYFADGMTDQLITDLSQVEALRVISRSAVMDYKQAKKPLRQIARELKVDVLVEGSVVQANQRVRISAQLVSAETAQNMWADSFEGDLKDVLALQKNVARSIVEKIRAKIRPDERKRLASARPVNPEAYQAYLKGRYAWNKYTEEGFRQALALFERAIEIDPTYAPAHAGLGDAWYGLSNIYVAPNDAMPRVRAAALRALELDESVAEAHATLGTVKAVYDWDWAGAEREYRRSLELRPNDALTRFYLGHLLAAVGRFDESIEETERAMALDPISPWLGAAQGWHLYLAHRFPEAERRLRKVIELNPEHYLAYAFLGITLSMQGDNAGAITALEKATSMDPNPDGLAQLGYAYARAGRTREARRILAELGERSKKGFVPASSFAFIHAGLDEKDEAFRWLDRACEDHSEIMSQLATEPVFDGLRSDPRMQVLLKRLGLDRVGRPAPQRGATATALPAHTRHRAT